MFKLSEKNKLHELINKPIMFDANIFMVGIENRAIDKTYSFENMKNEYIIPLLESFTNIYIHEEVYKELDGESRKLIDKYIDKGKVRTVSEGDLYGKDPLYTTIFNNIANHELIRYQRGNSTDRGEVYSMAYAAYHGMNYFCSKEIMVDNVADELEDLKDVDVITFDIVILQSFVYYVEKGDSTYNKGLKSLYKRYCADVIKRHELPCTLREYFIEVKDYL